MSRNGIDAVCPQMRVVHLPEPKAIGIVAILRPKRAFRPRSGQKIARVSTQYSASPAPLFAYFFWQDRWNQIANQRSVCNLERTSNGTDETCRLRRGEECGVCEDEPPEARLRPCRKRGNPVNPDRRADRIVRPYILSRAGKEIGVKCSPRLRRELVSSVPAEKLPALFFTIYNIESFQPLW